MLSKIFIIFGFWASLAAGAETLKRDENFFPLAVWLQSPRNAERFKAAGINTYVGLWRGPNEEQFNQIKAAGLKVICHQNQFALAHKDDPSIVAWMQDDEPDNAQSLGEGKGYGPPVLPEKVVARYNEIRAADSTRPVLLNLGQGVAWDNYIGRGVRRNHPEDYAEYVKGGDIVSFDIYPATHDHPDIKGKLEFVAKGVERLKKWAGPDREVWNCVEAKIGEKGEHISPRQLRAEVWMSLIHGSRGIIYFVHQFKPVFREASIFEDAPLLQAMSDVNKQITELAPILNSPDLPLKVTCKSEGSATAAIARKRGDSIYIFAVEMEGRQSWATFTFENDRGNYRVEPLDSGRRVQAVNGVFKEDNALNAREVRIYKLSPAK
jgi:hypothetical protein